jgi:hypothetical protein
MVYDATLRMALEKLQAANPGSDDGAKAREKWPAAIERAGDGARA